MCIFEGILPVFAYLTCWLLCVLQLQQHLLSIEQHACLSFQQLMPVTQLMAGGLVAASDHDALRWQWL